MSSLFHRLVVRTLPLVPRFVVQRFASRYVAGPGLEDALRVIRELKAEGAMSTVDVLGESVTHRDQTFATRDQYLATIDAIAAADLPANISVKPTAVGLAIDPALARENCAAICRKAGETGRLVRLDMEDSPYTEATLQLALDLRREFPNVGVVVQAYLRRTLVDADRLLGAKMNVRVCKGIYVEPRRIAYKDYRTVVENFGSVVDKLLAGGCYVGIATHDEACVQHALATIDRLGLKPDQYEFQMLLGVDPLLRKALLEGGHRLRVYVPYGGDWYAYSMRRLKENPSIVGGIINQVLGLGPASS